MIAQCLSKCWIIQLKEENRDLVLTSTQCGVKGHIIIYPQQPSKLATILPPPIEEITSPVCALFVGSSSPPEWLREHAKSLAVNAHRLCQALQWLKIHNPLYRDVSLNEECLQHLETNPVLAFTIEHIQPNPPATARYDANPGPDTSPISAQFEPQPIPFQNVVIADVNCHASSNELRAASLRHIKQRGGGYIQIPHDKEPENEFRKDNLLFLMIYHSVSYGIGGPKDSKRPVPLSLKRHPSAGLSWYSIPRSCPIEPIF
ncbi:hypothetical protein C8R44DRAFT_830239 [Mycena epipterygia]|nr:hypothetical protein C8R44DRAFT_830239 [Mycena epipterygia]